MTSQSSRMNSPLHTLKCLWETYFGINWKKFGFVGRNVTVETPCIIKGIQNVYLHDNTNIYANSLIISTRAKFIMKVNSGAAEGLTVITGNHKFNVGQIWMESGKNEIKESIFDRDIIVEEDVQIGTNVTLLNGVNIGRGAVIGSGAVCRNNVPPYAIVFGNPAKIVGFKFTPKDIINHEKILYSENERIPLEILEWNYKKFFSSRINEISNYIK